jgi:membrane protein DedA with SNARE-associated domain
MFEERIFELLRGHFAAHGYWTVAFALLLENAGIPVPGETILLFASFLAYSEHRLHLPWIILTATLAATLGDNLGYMIGRRGGRPLLDRYRHFFHIPERHVQRGEHLFARYGSVTIFFARFVFGMRIIAGPLAGVLHMPWRQFAIFNFLGAALWVTVISIIGYIFGRNWDALLHFMKHFNLIAMAAVVLAIAIWYFWRRRREKRKASGDNEPSAIHQNRV